MMFKVKATLGEQTKSVSVDRSAQFPEIKAKLESKFGCALTLSFKRPDGTNLSIITGEHFEQAVKEAANSGAKFLQLTCGGNGAAAPSRPSATTSTPSRNPSSTAIAPQHQQQPQQQPPPQQPQQQQPKPEGKSIFCPSCGTKLPENSRFCAGCGASINAPPSKPAVPAPTQQPPQQAPASLVPICPGCNKAVGGSVVKALEKSWHEACFVCLKCRAPIAGSFHAENGFPICKNCFEDSSEKCAKCGKALSGSYLIAEEGKAYHSQCFVCGICGNPLEGSYVIKSGTPVCPKCAH